MNLRRIGAGEEVGDIGGFSFWKRLLLLSSFGQQVGGN